MFGVLDSNAAYKQGVYCKRVTGYAGAGKAILQSDRTKHPSLQMMEIYWQSELAYTQYKVIERVCMMMAGGW